MSKVVTAMDKTSMLWNERPTQIEIIVTVVEIQQLIKHRLVSPSALKREPDVPVII